MGNENSLFQDCKFDCEVPVSTPKPWTLYHEKRKDGAKVSVFAYDKKQENISFIENAAKYLKVLRHPSILKFDTLEKTTEGIWLATEQVLPLETVLDDLKATEIVAGIYNILEALVFLHERGGLCHNNICVSSVFVSEDGSWRLGGLEYVCRFDQATANYLQNCRSLREQSTLSPEDKTGKAGSTKDAGRARDVYAFGVVAEYLLPYLDSLGEVTKTFALRIQDECLHDDPQRRPTASSLLGDSLFRNEFCEIVNFLRNVTLKTEEEKRNFFWDAASKLYSLPQDVVASRLVHPLLSRFVLLDSTACECVIPHLLTPAKGPEGRRHFVEGEINPILPERLFRKYVVPQVFKIFHVRDAHIRMVLLQHFGAYVHMFDRDTLSKVLLPQILLGIRDSNDDLVAMSLYAVANLVPLLGGDTVVGAHRAKLFSDASPNFSSSIQSETKKVSHNRTNGDLPRIKSGLSDKKTLKDMARDADREKRREEARKRSEDRRKRREQMKENPKQAQMVEDPEVAVKPADYMQEEEEDDMEPQDLNNKSDWSGWDPGNDVVENGVHESPDLDQTESDIDREIEDELHAMDTVLDNGRLQMQSPEQEVVDDVKVDWSDISKTPVQSDKAPSPKRLISAKGGMKLKGSKSKSVSPPPVSTGADDDEPWDSETWGEDCGKVSSPKSPKNVHGDKKSGGDDWQNSWGESSSEKPARKSSTPRSSTSSSPAHSKKEATKNIHNLSTSAGRKWKERPLGEGYDIKSVDIKVSSPSADMDFFADMKPEIKTDSNSLWSLLNKAEDSKDNSRTSPSKTGKGGQGSEQNQTLSPKVKKPPTSFAVADTEEMAETGWGDDDLDWNVDD